MTDLPINNPYPLAPSNMTQEDKEKYTYDMTVYGQAFYKEDNGTFKYVPTNGVLKRPNYVVLADRCPKCKDSLIHNRRGIECGAMHCDYEAGGKPLYE